MIRKNKNKLKSKTKSKILVLGLILIMILVGLFSPIHRSLAITCTSPQIEILLPDGTPSCSAPAVGVGSAIGVVACTAPAVPSSDGKSCVTPGAPDPNKSEFEKQMTDYGCGFGINGKSSLWPGCFLSVAYGVFYVIPSFILWLSAYFFNVLISITLSSKLFIGSTFIPAAWGVIRDISNIFFILILLYIAIKVILGLESSGVKKMIAKVIIIALLINFSMFFTQVIIDSSNILALIFYNKMQVDTKNSDGKPRPYESATGEKDVAGGMVNAFNPTSLLTPDFFNKAGTITVAGAAPTPGPVSFGILIGVTLIAGLLMFFAAYCFFIAGVSFLGRMIELFVLIIFSPFAFMSFTVPELAKYEYIGWDGWFKRLIAVSFMAPIFMFFMYFIFMLISTKPSIFENIITKTSNQSTIETILLVVIPEIIILLLLLKAADFAKKGGGKLGEMASSVGKMIGGTVVGAGIGGAAVLGRLGVGRGAAALANSEWARKREARGGLGSGVFRDVTKKIGSGSFDIRGVKIGGKDLASATGMSVGKAQVGGFEERKKGQVEKRQKRIKELEVGENETLKQNLNKTEIDLQDLLGKNAKEIESVDKLIEKKRQEANDANTRFNAAKGTDKEKGARKDLDQANLEVKNANLRKKALVNGDDWTDLKGVENATHHQYGTTGRTIDANGKSVSIDDLEKQKKTQAQDIKNENIERRTSYATSEQSGWGRTKGYVLSGGTYTKAASREAAHKIRTEVKLDSGTKA